MKELMLLIPIENIFSIDKVITAFLGAIIALGLNRAIKVYDDNRKFRDIRNLIISDLKKQIRPLQLLLKNIDSLLPYFDNFFVRPLTQEEMKHSFTHNYGFQTDTFKSHSRMEFFKSFKEEDFQQLMNIYNSIKIFETVNLFKNKEVFHKEYNNYLNNPTNNVLCKKPINLCLIKLLIINKIILNI